MVVKLDDMMKKLFTPKERAAIRRDARAIARRHMALRELRGLPGAASGRSSPCSPPCCGDPSSSPGKLVTAGSR